MERERIREQRKEVKKAVNRTEQVIKHTPYKELRQHNPLSNVQGPALLSETPFTKAEKQNLGLDQIPSSPRRGVSSDFPAEPPPASPRRSNLDQFLPKAFLNAGISPNAKKPKNDFEAKHRDALWSRGAFADHAHVTRDELINMDLELDKAMLKFSAPTKIVERLNVLQEAGDELVRQVTIASNVRGRLLAKILMLLRGEGMKVMPMFYALQNMDEQMRLNEQQLEFRIKEKDDEINRLSDAYHTLRNNQRDSSTQDYSQPTPSRQNSNQGSDHDVTTLLIEIRHLKDALRESEEGRRKAEDHSMEQSDRSVELEELLSDMSNKNAKLTRAQKQLQDEIGRNISLITDLEQEVADLRNGKERMDVLMMQREEEFDARLQDAVRAALEKDRRQREMNKPHQVETGTTIDLTANRKQGLKEWVNGFWSHQVVSSQTEGWMDYDALKEALSTTTHENERLTKELNHLRNSLDEEKRRRDEEKKALKGKEKEMDSLTSQRQRELDEKEKNLNQREFELDTRDKHYQARQADWNQKMDEEFSKVTALKRAIDSKQKDLENKQLELDQLQNDFNQKRLTLSDEDLKRRNELQQEERRIADLLAKLKHDQDEFALFSQQHEAKLNEMKTEMERREAIQLKDFQKKKAELATEEAALDTARKELGEKEERSRERERELNERERNLIERERLLVEKEEELGQREKMLEMREKHLLERETALKELERNNRKLREDLDQREDALRNREAELEKKLKELLDKEKNLEGKSPRGRGISTATNEDGDSETKSPTAQRPTSRTRRRLEKDSALPTDSATSKNEQYSPTVKAKRPASPRRPKSASRQTQLSASQTLEPSQDLDQTRPISPKSKTHQSPQRSTKSAGTQIGVQTDSLLGRLIYLTESTRTDLDQLEDAVLHKLQMFNPSQQSPIANRQTPQSRRQPRLVGRDDPSDTVKKTSPQDGDEERLNLKGTQIHRRPDHGDDFDEHKPYDNEEDNFDQPHQSNRKAVGLSGFDGLDDELNNENDENDLESAIVAKMRDKPITDDDAYRLQQFTMMNIQRMNDLRDALKHLNQPSTTPALDEQAIRLDERKKVEKEFRDNLLLGTLTGKGQNNLLNSIRPHDLMKMTGTLKLGGNLPTSRFGGTGLMQRTLSHQLGPAPKTDTVSLGLADKEQEGEDEDEIVTQDTFLKTGTMKKLNLTINVPDGKSKTGSGTSTSTMKTIPDQDDDEEENGRGGFLAIQNVSLGINLPQRTKDPANVIGKGKKGPKDGNQDNDQSDISLGEIESEGESNDESEEESDSAQSTLSSSVISDKSKQSPSPKSKTPSKGKGKTTRNGKEKTRKIVVAALAPYTPFEPKSKPKLPKQPKQKNAPVPSDVSNYSGPLRSLMSGKASSHKRKPLSWLQRLINMLYEEKIANDAACDRRSVYRQPFPAHVFQWITQRYGIKRLMEMVGWEMLNTVDKYKTTKEEVALFSHFVDGDMDIGHVSFYLLARMLTQTVKSANDAVTTSTAQRAENKLPTKLAISIAALFFSYTSEKQWRDIYRSILGFASKTSQLQVGSSDGTNPVPPTPTEAPTPLSPTRNPKSARLQAFPSPFDIQTSDQSIQSNDSVKPKGRVNIFSTAAIPTTSTINLDTFLSVLVRLYDQQYSFFVPFVQSVFEGVDSDKDGMITREEFEDLCFELSPLLSKKEPLKLYNSVFGDSAHNSRPPKLSLEQVQDIVRDAELFRKNICGSLFIGTEDAVSSRMALFVNIMLQPFRSSTLARSSLPTHKSASPLYAAMAAKKSKSVPRQIPLAEQLVPLMMVFGGVSNNDKATDVFKYAKEGDRRGGERKKLEKVAERERDKLKQHSPQESGDPKLSRSPSAPQVKPAPTKESAEGKQDKSRPSKASPKKESKQEPSKSVGRVMSSVLVKKWTEIGTHFEENTEKLFESLDWVIGDVEEKKANKHRRINTLRNELEPYRAEVDSLIDDLRKGEEDSTKLMSALNAIRRWIGALNEITANAEQTLLMTGVDEASVPRLLQLLLSQTEQEINLLWKVAQIRESVLKTALDDDMIEIPSD
ncbi:hypothetical protein BLNAU_500 [Blattamonas nauphoetae]|uniref:EF-hand domain-containing protein n=1 Tax=Blattamonas nauphoetae TaxID=2049346 RepID=A0ABQ9YLF6_9EUKA|nr:hypothetical protein BLNAU_500 [Blattamonas nauphoetae]